MKDPKQVLVDKIESQLGITAVLLKELKKLVADMPDDATPTAGDNQAATLCPLCKGSGRQPADPVKWACAVCSGTGKVSDMVATDQEAE